MDVVVVGTTSIVVVRVVKLVMVVTDVVMLVGVMVLWV